MGKVVYDIDNERTFYSGDMNYGGECIPLADMSRKIVLISINNVKFFSAVDMNKDNEGEIRQLLKNGYKPLNSRMEDILTQNYTFCSNCGEYLDMSQKSKIIITDIGQHFRHLVNKNTYPAKELQCNNCGHVGVYYYDLYATNEEKSNFFQNSMRDDSSVFIKIRFAMEESGVKFYIPVMINFNDFLNYFDRETAVAPGVTRKSDLADFLINQSDRVIFEMLMDENIQELVDVILNNKDEDTLKLRKKLDMLTGSLNEDRRYVFGDNLGIRFLAPRIMDLGSYSKESECNQINKILSYGENQQVLLDCIVRNFK